MSDTPTDAKTPAPMADAPRTPMQDRAVIITARPAAGFWRAGRHHPPTPVRHEAGSFSDAQMVALLGEPQVVVASAADADDGPADGGPPGRRARRNPAP